MKLTGLNRVDNTVHNKRYTPIYLILVSSTADALSKSPGKSR